jgi:hypothetical protein
MRVSGFAAGCAICGAELDPRRAQGPRSITDRVRFVLGSMRSRTGERKPLR